ncbi:4-amino-6-deoxy-N-Acetyl-D-hexosaminyl-(Lipid carrier) acetyltrasferase [plant metagenome]|uniref:4-amino-6-deoxy-N-Acetyl-D-hexosaminyl-(Lipid carrier) acetyltrasferase n=1 Tax=plant metagenome TaxID=1297885 RepID=A0A484SD48_9ZZZZ
MADAAELSGNWSGVIFADDGYPRVERAVAWPVVASLASLVALRERCVAAIVAIGNQEIRARLQAEIVALDIPVATVIHPSAWVSRHAEVGEGSTIMAGAVVGACAKLGRGVIVNANATADHDTVLEDFAHLGVGVQLAGGVHIGTMAWLQAGACAGYRVRVPDGAVVQPGERLIAN